MPQIDKALLELLRCPVSGGRLRYDAARSELVSVDAALAYPVLDGIAHLLVTAARPLSAGECEQYNIAVDSVRSP